jgi:uncharacterized protein (DUF433 family)
MGMDAAEADTFWDDCDLVSRDPEIVHGAPVLKGTRLPADTLVENVEAFMELDRMTKEEAIEETLECFPSAPGGKDTLRKLLAYHEAHLNQAQPS